MVKMKRRVADIPLEIGHPPVCTPSKDEVHYSAPECVRELLTARIVRPIIPAVGHTITVAIAITGVRDTIAVSIAHWTVTIPAAALVHPASVAFDPVSRMIEITDALAFPMTPYPDMAITTPIPVTWCPDKSGTRRRHNFMARRGRRNIDKYVHPGLRRWRDSGKG